MMPRQKLGIREGHRLKKFILSIKHFYNKNMNYLIKAG